MITKYRRRLITDSVIRKKMRTQGANVRKSGDRDPKCFLLIYKSSTRASVIFYSASLPNSSKTGPTGRDGDTFYHSKNYISSVYVQIEIPFFRLPIIRPYLYPDKRSSYLCNPSSSSSSSINAGDCTAGAGRVVV